MGIWGRGILLSWVMGGTSAVGADRIVMLPDGTGERKEWVGTVEELKGPTLTLTVGAKSRSFVAWDVEHIESDWTASHQQGRRWVARGDWQSAMAAYREAYKQEERRWAKRLLLRESAEVLRELHDLAQAATLALVLFREDPNSTQVAAIPLKWDARPATREDERLAAEWLAMKDQPAAQLLGASWLLGTVRRTEAIQILQALTDSANPGLAQMAQAQLWRVETVSVTAQEFDRWKNLTQRMHPSLRPGPYYVLAGCNARLHPEPEASAIEYLRIPTLFPAHGSLAADSLLQAGRILEKSGDRDQSALLFQEVISRHATSPAAQELGLSHP